MAGVSGGPTTDRLPSQSSTRTMASKIGTGPRESGTIGTIVLDDEKGAELSSQKPAVKKKRNLFSRIFGGKSDPDAKRAKKTNKLLNKRLKEQHRAHQYEVFLLGAGGSGKTTVLKQMKYAAERRKERWSKDIKASEEESHDWEHDQLTKTVHGMQSASSSSASGGGSSRHHHHHPHHRHTAPFNSIPKMTAIVDDIHHNILSDIRDLCQQNGYLIRYCQKQLEMDSFHSTHSDSSLRNGTKKPSSPILIQKTHSSSSRSSANRYASSNPVKSPASRTATSADAPLQIKVTPSPHNHHGYPPSASLNHHFVAATNIGGSSPSSSHHDEKSSQKDSQKQPSPSSSSPVPPIHDLSLSSLSLSETNSIICKKILNEQISEELTMELAECISSLWNDPAMQITFEIRKKTGDHG